MKGFNDVFHKAAPVSQIDNKSSGAVRTLAPPPASSNTPGNSMSAFFEESNFQSASATANPTSFQVNLDLNESSCQYMYSSS